MTTKKKSVKVAKRTVGSLRRRVSLLADKWAREAYMLKRAARDAGNELLAVKADTMLISAWELRAEIRKQANAPHEPPPGNATMTATDTIKQEQAPNCGAGGRLCSSAVLGDNANRSEIPNSSKCVGCGELFEPWDKIYRCVDCDAEYHRHCIRKHFDVSEREWVKNVIAALNSQKTETAIAILEWHTSDEKCKSPNAPHEPRGTETVNNQKPQR